MFRRRASATRSLLEELHEIPLFSALKQRELHHLEQYLYLRSFKKDEALFHEGTPGYALFILRSGRIRLTRSNADGGERLVGRMLPGEMLGELVILCAANRNFSAIAEEDCEVVVLFKHDFMEFVESWPASGVRILLSMIRLVGERYLEQTDALAQDPESDGNGNGSG